MFRKIDEINNAFVADGRVHHINLDAFRAMTAECEATADEAHDLVADLYSNNGDLIETTLMTRQMRVRAQRVLEKWL